MANTVQQIIAQVKSLCASTLGAEYQELRRVHEVEKNSFRDAKLAYGVRPLGAVNAETVTRSYTLDHTFELILTSNVARNDDDSQHEDVMETLFDNADEMFKAMVNTKLSLPLVVMSVQEPGISDPEILDDQKVVVLRMQFVVKYRSNL